MRRDKVEDGTVAGLYLSRSDLHVLRERAAREAREHGLIGHTWQSIVRRLIVRSNAGYLRDRTAVAPSAGGGMEAGA